VEGLIIDLNELEHEEDDENEVKKEPLKLTKREEFREEWYKYVEDWD
jgi:hypothetical protein